ncbi:MAG: flavin reductase family protein [Thermodesulfovibrionales bacterium]
MLREIRSNIYHLLHPKMVFFLTSVSKDGRHNVMTCAWATPVSEEPPIVLVCVSRESYTAELIRQSKEFVINIPSKKMLKALWLCGKISGRDADKFKKASLKYSSAKVVKPPLVDDCLGYIECKLWKVIEAGECYAFFGKVLYAEADDDYLSKGLWKDSADIPLHLGGNRIVYFK